MQAKTVLSRFNEEIAKEKWRHATDLDHSSKVYFSRQAATLHVRFFSVISNKSTLGEYRDLIEGDPQKFYNKCVQYLLEKVCGYLATLGVSDDDLSVVLEQRNHDYDRLIRFLGKVKENPIYEQSKNLRILNPFAMVAKPKDEEPLLRYADIVAHAVYQCVNKSTSNYNIPEYRYFEELSARFAADSNGRILGTGLKAIHTIEQLELDDQVLEVFRRCRAMPPKVGSNRLR